MEVLSHVPASQHSVSSPDGLHVASLNGAQLEVRRIPSLELVRTLNVSPVNDARFLCIRWSPLTADSATSNRLLIADENTTHVWDLQDSQWTATIDNGSGGMGKVANVEFGCDEHEVLVFSSFGAKLSIWSLSTGQSIEIKDFKFSHKGFGYNRRGRDGVFALLTRPGPQDVINLYTAGSYNLLKSMKLPPADCQGVKWSPDGRWLAAWDTPTNGYKINIYTPDGNLYRTFRGDYFEEELNGLGVKSIEWEPHGDFLLIGGYEDHLIVLGTKTFTPAVQLHHARTIKDAHAQIWQEEINSTGRLYARVSHPFSLPVVNRESKEEIPRVGVSIMNFNANGVYLATKDDSTPNACWIWNLSKMACEAVVLQQSSIKDLEWHPTDPSQLLIQTAAGESILYRWTSEDSKPHILDLSSVKFQNQVDARWLNTSTPAIMVGNTQGYVITYPEGQNPVQKGSNYEAADSDDSLYDVLSGKKPIPTFNYDGMTTISNGSVDDTFHYRQEIKA